MAVELLSTLFTEIVVFVAIGTISFITGLLWRYKQTIKKIQKRQNWLENSLYGFEKDDTDDGFIPRTDARLEEQNNKLDNQSEEINEMQNDITEIKTTLEHIRNKIDGDSNE